MQRRRVVDAVAEEAHCVAGRLQRAHDALLLHRVDLDEQVGRWRQHAQRLLAHLSQCLAGQHARRIEPDRGGQMRGHVAVVAGDDLDLHAARRQVGQHLRHVRTRRIGKAQEALEHQAGLFADVVAVAQRHRPAGQRQHAHAVLALCTRESLELRAQRVIQRHLGGAAAHGRAHRQHLRERALGDQPRAAASFRHHEGEPLAHEVVGDLVALLDAR